MGSSASHRALRLSVLDQSPVPAGPAPAQALANSLDLARHVDRLGYTRLWYSEHHAMDLLACTAPEILIARAAAETTRIRVGSGGNYAPALLPAQNRRSLPHPPRHVPQPHRPRHRPRSRRRPTGSLRSAPQPRRRAKRALPPAASRAPRLP